MSLVTALALTLSSAASAVAQESGALKHRPIVLVHGYKSNAGVWGDMQNRVREYGYGSDELYAFDYSAFTPGDTSLMTIADKLEKYIADNELTKKSPDGKIDLVAHSMGGLVARAYLKQNEGHRDTAHLVTYATPNHGTNPADWGCGIGIQCDGQVKSMTRGSAFLTWLNSGSEIPGNTRYATFRSNIGDELIINVGSANTDLCDGLVFGVTENGEDAGNYSGRTSILKGAENFISPCIPHGDFYHDKWTVEKTLQWISDPDGSHTPKAAQLQCGTLDEYWGKRKWVGAHAQSCVTATGDKGSTTKDVYTELQIRGCGYYYGILGALWTYAGRSGVHCGIAYDGILWRDGIWGAHNKSSISVNARSAEIRTDTVPAQKGQRVSGDWTFDVHAYQDHEWDVKQGRSGTGTLVIQ